jgi:hypothetical protein
MQMNRYVVRIFLHEICRSLDALPYDKVAITPKIEKPPCTVDRKRYKDGKNKIAECSSMRQNAQE